MLVLSVFVVSESLDIPLLERRDVSLEYPINKSVDSDFVKDKMMVFDGLDYEVVGDKIILNKKDVFQDCEIPLIQEQDCLEFDKDNNCVKWTDYDKDYFIEQAIKKQLEFIAGVNVERQAKSNKVVSVKGKIGIKTKQ